MTTPAPETAAGARRTFTCWIWAKSIVEALNRANGEDGYGSWDSLASAKASAKNPECVSKGEKLFRVDQIVTREETP
jgi:hypothetical protein